MNLRGNWDERLVGMIDQGWLVAQAKGAQGEKFCIDGDWSMAVERNGLPCGLITQSDHGKRLDCHFDSVQDAADFRRAAVGQGLMQDDAMLDVEDAAIALAFAHQQYLEAGASVSAEAAAVQTARACYLDRFSHGAPLSDPQPKAKNGVRLDF